MDSNAARILIVDDDPDIRQMLSALITKEGLVNMVAYDGETALRLVSAEAPDMLLVDVKMPGLDGMEVLRRVKEADPHLPVVLITAYADIPASVAAMRAGAYDYLAKPFEHSEVIRVVRAALNEMSGSAGVAPLPKKTHGMIVCGSRWGPARRLPASFGKCTR